MRALALALALAGCGHGGGSSGPASPGSGSAVTEGSGGSATTQAGGGAECEEKDCGPRLGMPQKACHDGTMGGPTGKCLKNDAGTCSWEVKTCPQ